MKRIAKFHQLHLSASPLSEELLCSSHNSTSSSKVASDKLLLSPDSSISLALALASQTPAPSLSSGGILAVPTVPTVSLEEVGIAGWIGMRANMPMLQVTLNVSDAESAEFAAWAAHTAPLSEASRRRLYTAVEAQTAAFIRAVDTGGYHYGSVAAVAVKCSAEGIPLAWSHPVAIHPEGEGYNRALEARVEQTVIRDGVMRITLYLSRAAERLQWIAEDGVSLYACRYAADHTATPKISGEVSAAGSADAAHVFRFETQTPPILPYFDLISRKLSAPRPFYLVDDTDGCLILSGPAGFTPAYGSSLRPTPTYSAWVEDYPLYAADDRLWIQLPTAADTSSLPDTQRVLWDSHIPTFMPGEPLISSHRRWGMVKRVIALPRQGSAIPLILFADNGIYLLTLTQGVEGGFTAKARYLRPMGEDIRIPTSDSTAMSVHTLPFATTSDYITGVEVSTPSLHLHAIYRLEGSVDGHSWHSVCTFSHRSGMLCAPGFRWWRLRITVPDITLPLGNIEVKSME